VRAKRRRTAVAADGAPVRPAVAVLAIAAAAALAACAGGKAPAEPGPPPSLILVTVDTLRADHLGVDGYPRDTSPNLDALAREGTWFSRAYAQSATTASSHATLFTAVLPPVHGVLSNTGHFPDRPSLMRALHDRGYATAGFVSSVVLGGNFGLKPAFDHFDDQLTTVEPKRGAHFERPAAETVDAALRFTAARDPSRPLFLWIHLIDPHGPYAAPVDPDRYVGAPNVGPPSRELAIGTSDWVRDAIPAYQVIGDHRDSSFYVDRYDGEIHYADTALGALFIGLKQQGLYDSSLIAVTADHGETLAERGHRRVFSHGTITYEEDVRVPLIVREPDGARRLSAIDRAAPAQLVDLAPTLLDLLGVSVPTEFAGRSLLRAPTAEDAPLVAFGACGTEALEQRIGTQLTVRRGPWRYVVNLPDGSEELYDHRDDPAESENVAARAPQELAALHDILAPFLASIRARAAAAGAVVSPEKAAGLRALGYAE
jgi:arylsulfatase